MRWWNPFWRSSAKLPREVMSACLTLSGWNEDTPAREMRTWHDIDGDVLSLSISSEPFPNCDRANETEVRRWCRAGAESRGGGLVEAQKLDNGVRLIYKRLQMPAYVYTGALVTHVGEVWLVWTIVAAERGMTGVREAVVTVTLMKEGTLKPEEYEVRWGQDPYEPEYHSVDRSVLRFMSDDERYDEQFPKHPLSKVRRVLTALPLSVEYDL